MSKAAAKVEVQSAPYLLLRRDATILEFSRNWETGVVGADNMHRWVGRNLFHLIAGDATRMHIDMLLKRAIYLESAISFDYRCDGGGMRRECRMHLWSSGKDTCTMSHEIIRETPLASVSFPPHVVPRIGTTFILRCSMCCRVEVDQAWTEDPDMHRDGDRYLSHGMTCVFTICPDCRGKAKRLRL